MEDLSPTGRIQNKGLVQLSLLVARRGGEVSCGGEDYASVSLMLLL